VWPVGTGVERRRLARRAPRGVPRAARRRERERRGAVPRRRGAASRRRLRQERPRGGRDPGPETGDSWAGILCTREQRFQNGPPHRRRLGRRAGRCATGGMGSADSGRAAAAARVSRRRNVRRSAPSAGALGSGAERDGRRPTTGAASEAAEGPRQDWEDGGSHGRPGRRPAPTGFRHRMDCLAHRVLRRGGNAGRAHAPEARSDKPTQAAKRSEAPTIPKQSRRAAAWEGGARRLREGARSQPPPRARELAGPTPPTLALLLDAAFAP